MDRPPGDGNGYEWKGMDALDTIGEGGASGCLETAPSVCSDSAPNPVVGIMERKYRGLSGLVPARAACQSCWPP